MESSAYRKPVQAQRLEERFGPRKSYWYAVAADGRCPSLKVGRKVLFYEDEVAAWLESQRRPRVETA